MFQLALPFILGGVFVLMSLDGMRIVFRGTRDYLSVSLGANPRASRFGASVAAVGCVVSGAAALITLSAWIGGTHPIGRWQDSSADIKKP